jgi:plasmid stabilization system protein ParE
LKTNYKVVVLPKAKKDLSKISKWYNIKVNGLGKRFLDSFELKTKYISQHPKSYAIRYDDIRISVMTDFPFLIHYILDNSKKTIVIIAVFHSSENPEKWHYNPE